MIKLFITIFCLFFVSFTFTFPVSASEVWKTFCNQNESLEKAHIRERLQPWFDAMNRKILEQRKFTSVTEELKDELKENQTFVCWLLLKPNGKLLRERTSENISDSLKRRVLTLIEKSIPSQSPPDHLPYPNCILVKFQRTSDGIKALPEWENRADNLVAQH